MTNINITNAEFINTLFKNLSPGEIIWGTSFKAPPSVKPDSKVKGADGRDWKGSVINSEVLMQANYCSDQHNTFFQISSFDYKHQFKALHVICLDDVGTKGDEDKVTLQPSWKLVTSPGNYQIGYLLDAPVTNEAEARTLVGHLHKTGPSDDIGASLKRYMRMPIGVNNKEKYGKPFHARLVEWEPELRYTPAQIENAYGLDLSQTVRVPEHSGAQPEPANDPIYQFLLANNLARGEVRTGANDLVLVDITCPFGDEHTDDRDIAHYIMGGSFKCFHAHCTDRTSKDLRTRLKETHGEDLEVMYNKICDNAPPDPAIIAMFDELPELENLRVLIEQGIDDPDRVINAFIRAKLEPGGALEAQALKQAAKLIGISLKPLHADIKKRTKARKPKMSNDEKMALFDGNFIMNHGGKVRICRMAPDPEFGDRVRMDSLAAEGFNLLYSGKFVNLNGEQVPFTKAFLSWADKPIYKNGVGLYPSGNPPPGVFNLWQGWGVTPEQGPWKTIQDHFEHIVADGESEIFEYLMGWLAYTFQNPDMQTGTCIVLRGEQGTGKTLIYTLMARLFSQHALRVTNSKHLTGSFNKHLLGCCFLFADEAMFAGDPQMRGPLKSLITDDTVIIEGKGVDVFAAKNRMSIMMATNSDWAAPVESGDRRFMIADVGDQRKGDAEYFRKLHKAIEGDEAAHFLQAMLDYDLSDFEIRDIPKTDGHSELMLQTIGQGVVGFVIELLTDSTLSIDGAEVRKKTIYQNYETYCSNNKERRTLSDRVFWQQFKRIFPTDGPKAVVDEVQKKGPAGVRYRVIKFPDLQYLREYFCDKKGLNRSIWDKIG